MSDQPRPACIGVDPEVFFPFESQAADVARAKAVCARCPLATDCLEVALGHRAEGIWGGTTTAEREKIRRRRGRQANRTAPAAPALRGAAIVKARMEAAGITAADVRAWGRTKGVPMLRHVEEYLADRQGASA
jgi:WhiB family redox-sensing transcriptional regulator